MFATKELHQFGDVVGIDEALDRLILHGAIDFLLRSAAGQARVVDEDIGSAKLRANIIEQALDGLGIADVGYRSADQGSYARCRSPQTPEYL